MITFNTAPDTILDSIFLNLNEEDLHETLRVSKSWFWASIRRIKKLEITSEYNPLKSIAEFYNHHASAEDEMDWRELFKHLVLDELVVNREMETVNYLVNNGCNSAELTIQTSKEESLVTLASLTKVTRLQSFEYCTNRDMEWHSFLIECFKSSDSGFDPNIECPVEKIKLNSSGWKTEDPVLHSVTKLSVWHVTIDILRTLVAHCPNLETLHCFWGDITQDWYQVFPANVKRIELHHFSVDSHVATIIDASTNSARNLFSYLCQNWESVEKFHYDGNIHFIGRAVYEAFPKQKEEVFGCEIHNNDMNLGSPLFQCRKIQVEWFGPGPLGLTIPPAKTVKFEFYGELDFKFSPGAVCIEPGKVERLALLLINGEPGTHEPFGSSSFEGFCRLTSVTFHQISAASIKIALDQCPSVKKLKVKFMKAMTIGHIGGESSYNNVCELVLEECHEAIDEVFKAFPCLSEFKYYFRGKDAMRKMTTDWLWRHLIEKDQKYGVVFECENEISYMVSDDLEPPLAQAQKLLKEYLHSESVCYLKGFKLLPRASKQKMLLAKFCLQQL